MKDSTIDEQIVALKEICVSLYEAGDTVEFRGDKIIYKDNYAKVIQMVMNTKYRVLFPMNGMTLSEIAFMFGETRQSINQVEERVLGKTETKGRKKRAGKLTSPSVIGKFRDEEHKMSFMSEVKDSLNRMYGKAK